MGENVSEDNEEGENIGLSAFRNDDGAVHTLMWYNRNGFQQCRS